VVARRLWIWRSWRDQARRPVLVAALMIVMLPGIAACAGQQEQRSAQNLCARYQQLGASLDALKSLDVGTTGADAVHARADAALVKLDQLQAVSEGQYDTLISSLRSAINDVKQSAVEAGDAFAAARHEREVAVQRLAQNLGPLKQRLDEQCTPAG
jgi:hypothetical protein